MSDRTPTAVKIVVSGETALVGALSEIEALTVQDEDSLDVGRITLDDDLILYLFGTEAQTPWDDLCHGAIGAVVVAEIDRLADCSSAIAFFDSRQVPYLVAVDATHDPERVRRALAVEPAVPIVQCDVRARAGAKHVLVTVAEHALARRAWG
jgi:signal recognition particle receptor subunit beta